MGQQQILLIVLGALIVGIATETAMSFMRSRDPAYPYAIHVQWSEGEHAYVATLPEFPDIVVTASEPTEAVSAAMRATLKKGNR